ncbi:butyrophilin subfamily 2 member A2-like [Lampetra fluviatilis]
MTAQGREGNWKEVERHLPELREWIGTTPSRFLHELKRRNVVTEQEYWRAFTIPDATKRADSILLPVMKRGEGECRELLETLEQQWSWEWHFLDMLKTSHVCSPTLNPNSAHRQLQISADLSTATWNTEYQPYVNNPERFALWPIVLCFENFSSGDHYWEVDVRASQNCSIGVAQITHLERVVVRLDFNTGKLSFYNARTMELLHSFDDIPSGPLFPAMQVKSGSVTIYEAQSLKNLTVDESKEDIQICDHFANSGDHRTKNTNEEKGDSKVISPRTGMVEPPMRGLAPP